MLGTGSASVVPRGRCGAIGVNVVLAELEAMARLREQGGRSCNVMRRKLCGRRECGDGCGGSCSQSAKENEGDKSDFEKTKVRVWRFPHLKYIHMVWVTLMSRSRPRFMSH